MWGYYGYSIKESTRCPFVVITVTGLDVFCHLECASRVEMALSLRKRPACVIYTK